MNNLSFIIGLFSIHDLPRLTWKLPALKTSTRIYRIYGVSQKSTRLFPNVDISLAQTWSASGPKLVDVQPQNQVGDGSIALPKNLNINPGANNGGRKDEQIVLYVFFAGLQRNRRQQLFSGPLALDQQYWADC